MGYEVFLDCGFDPCTPGGDLKQFIFIIYDVQMLRLVDSPSLYIILIFVCCWSELYPIFVNRCFLMLLRKVIE